MVKSARTRLASVAVGLSYLLAVACGSHVDEEDSKPRTMTPETLFTNAMASVAPLTEEAKTRALAHFRAGHAYAQLNDAVRAKGCVAGELGTAQRVRGVLYATFPAHCSDEGREAAIVLCESVSDESCRTDAVAVVAAPHAGRVNVETLELQDGVIHSELVTPELPRPAARVSTQSQAASVLGDQACSVIGGVLGSIVGAFAGPLLQLLPLPAGKRIGGGVGKFLGGLVGGVAGYNYGPNMCSLAENLLGGVMSSDFVRGVTSKFKSVIDGLLGSVTPMFSAQQAPASQSIPNDAAQFDQNVTTDEPATNDSARDDDKNVGGLDYGDFAPDPQNPNG